MLKTPMLKTLVMQWWDDRRGATAVEYGLIIGVLVLTIVAGLGNTYNAIQYLFEDTNNTLVPLFR